MKLNLEKLKYTLKSMQEYLFPIKKITSKFGSIKTKEDLQSFIQERAAHVTQTTLYGYLKTRILSYPSYTKSKYHIYNHYNNLWSLLPFYKYP